MALKGNAAIVGAAQYRPEKYATAPRMFHLEQVADLASRALADAGLRADDVDGLGHSRAAVSRGFRLRAGDGRRVSGPLAQLRRGSRSRWLYVRSAWSGVPQQLSSLACARRCCVFCRPAWRRLARRKIRRGWPAPCASVGHSTAFGAPEAEFDLPYGHMGQNTGYAMIAQRYAAQYGYDPLAMAKIAVDQRFNALANPDAMFYGKPLAADEVLASKMVADPLRVLEIVMPVAGGAAVIVASKEVAARARNRGAVVTGFGERLTYKSPTYAPEMTQTPIGPASQRAFAMAGLKPGDVDAAQIYDCYTITVLLTLEDAGFAPKGEGMRWVRDNDLTYRGKLPDEYTWWPAQFRAVGNCRPGCLR